MFLKTEALFAINLLARLFVIQDSSGSVVGEPNAASLLSEASILSASSGNAAPAQLLLLHRVELSSSAD